MGGNVIEKLMEKEEKGGSSCLGSWTQYQFSVFTSGLAWPFYHPVKPIMVGRTCLTSLFCVLEAGNKKYSMHVRGSGGGKCMEEVRNEKVQA